MSLAELQNLLPPPADPVGTPTPLDWQVAENLLGLRLPSDYKAFLAAYGNGRVDDFLDIFIPASPDAWNNLLSRLEEQRELFAEMQRGQHPVGYDLHPAKPGLVPIGQTDNGDMIFFLAEGDQEEWKIATLPARGRDVQVFDGGLSAFLVAAIRHEVDAFPDDFAKPAAAFIPAEQG